MKIEQMAVGDLRPNPRNSRIHSPEQIQALARSIGEYGWTMPILIDEDGVILAGHGRLAAAKQLGLAEVSCIRLLGLSQEQKRAYVIADNKLALESEWDESLLKLELQDLLFRDYDVSLLGFGDEEINLLLRDAADGGSAADVVGWTDEDKVPDAPPPDRVVTRRGDVWCMGRNRLMCGDSTSSSDMRSLAPDDVDLWLTDPPYNVAYQGGTKEKLTIANDSMSDSAFRSFLSSAYSAADSVMKPGAAFYIWHADSEGFNFRGAARDVGWPVRQCLVWRKSSMVLGRQDYQWQHEPCLYGWKPGAAHRWFGGRKLTTIAELGWSDGLERLDDGRWMISVGGRSLILAGDAEVECVPGSVIEEAKPRRNGEHPTMKPVALFERQLLNSTAVGDLVLDSFGGSGTTLIAAQKAGRVARLMELDAKYCDVIVKRWQDYVGKQATLEADGATFDEVMAQRVGVIDAA